MEAVMAVKKWYVVNTRKGLNLREAPNKKAKVLAILKHGEKVEVDNSVEGLPDGWVAVKDRGFVMKQYIA